MRELSLATSALIVPLLSVSACNAFLPCEEACARLRECRVVSMGVSFVENDSALCAGSGDVISLDRHYCEKRCRGTNNGERWSCFAELECRGDSLEETDAALARCNETGGGGGEPAEPSECRSDCIDTARECGAKCVARDIDEEPCAACFHDCDSANRGCVDWCKLIGQ